MQVDDIDVFIGIDVGKSEHWATALTTAGECLHDRPLPNDEARLREVYEHLGEHGRLLVVVDQPATPPRRSRSSSRRSRPISMDQATV